MSTFESFYTKILKIVLPILLFIPIILSLASCQASDAIDSAEIVNELLPNLWVFLSHIFASVVLITVIIWLVWNPTKIALAKRHDYIASQIRQAEEANAKSLKDLEAANQQKIEAYDRANTIIETAQKESFLIKEKTKTEVKEIATQIKQDALEEVRLTQQKLESDMNQKIIDIAFATAETIIQKEIKDKDTDKYIDQLIKDLKKDYNND